MRKPVLVITKFLTWINVYTKLLKLCPIKKTNIKSLIFKHLFEQIFNKYIHVIVKNSLFIVCYIA